jgi:hypothetical protein
LIVSFKKLSYIIRGRRRAGCRTGEDMRDDAQAFERVKRAEMVKAFIESIEYRARFGQP